MALEADKVEPGPARARRLSLLAPGALSGFRLTAVLLSLSTVLWAVLLDRRDLAFLVAAPSYLVLYLSAALWASRGWRMRQPVSPDTTRFVFVALAGLGMLLPWVVARSYATTSSDTFLPGLISPLVGLEAFDRGRAVGGSHWVLLALAGVVFVATDRMLARRRRPTAEAAAPTALAASLPPGSSSPDPQGSPAERSPRTL
jgi:hypothetical protein